MSEYDHILEKEDYLEPGCPLCGEPYGVVPAAKPVPQRRILEKMDEYMGRRDYAGALRHLLYWLEEARLGHDLRGQLMLCNELTGYYRKTSDREKAVEYGTEALRLLEKMGFEETISAGTTYVNFATACNAFGENLKALELFEKARKIYENSGQTRPELLGGLYNNMGLVMAEMQRYDEAFGLYEKAMKAMEQVPGGELEQAITCLNMADAVEGELGAEAGENKIAGLLEKAEKLLDTPSLPRDGYYAFVCEKCAPSFSYYGYFLEEEELMKRAEAVYRDNEMEKER